MANESSNQSTPGTSSDGANGANPKLAARPARTKKANVMTFLDPPQRAAASAPVPDQRLLFSERDHGGARSSTEEQRPATPASREKTQERERRKLVPSSAEERFVRVGNTYHFGNGHEAFRDHGRKMSTSSENQEVVRTLVDFAIARGYAEIKVSGSERFKRLAWQAATAAGIEVKNFTPTEIERARMIREFAQSRSTRPASSSAIPAGSVSAGSSAPSAEVSVPAPGETRRSSAVKRPDERSRIVVGELIDHGAAPYQHNRFGDPSYYIKLRTSTGEQTLWGVDFERALSEAHTAPSRGDVVGILRSGKKHVTVTERERDEQGNVVRELPKESHRNGWVVEKADYFEERMRDAQALRDRSRSPRAVAAERPQLAGSLANIKLAELFAQQHLKESDRDRFVSAVREAFADDAANGKALPKARLVEPRRPQDRSREFERAPS